MIGKRFQVREFVAFAALAASLSGISATGQTKRSPEAPNRERVETIVREAYDKFRGNTEGKNADYIPYLAQVDSKLFGIAVVTTDNQVFELGDVKYSFAIESISKALVSSMTVHPTAEFMDFIAQYKIKFKDAVGAMQHVEGEHNRRETPLMAASIERMALRQANLPSRGIGAA